MTAYYGDPHVDPGCEEVETPSAWRPMESAPKDGTAILVQDSSNVFIAAWLTAYSECLRGNKTAWWSVGAKHFYQPTQMILMNPQRWRTLD